MHHFHSNLSHLVFKFLCHVQAAAVCRVCVLSRSHVPHAKCPCELSKTMSNYYLWIHSHVQHNIVHLLGLVLGWFP